MESLKKKSKLGIVFLFKKSNPNNVTSRIYNKQTNKKIIWLNSLNQVENTEFTLVEEKSLRDFAQTNYCLG